jgi:hypothetical protein
MSLGLGWNEDMDALPAFLLRRASTPEGEPCGEPQGLLAGIWGAVRRILPSAKIDWRDGMRNGVDSMDTQNNRRAAGVAQLQRPILGGDSDAAQEDRRLLDAIKQPVEAIRVILGERAINSVLTSLLRQSNANLERYGARQPDHDSAELESLRAQLKQAQEINSDGLAAYRTLKARCAELEIAAEALMAERVA